MPVSATDGKLEMSKVIHINGKFVLGRDLEKSKCETVKLETC